MTEFAFIRPTRRYDKEKWVEVDDTELIREIAVIAFYQRAPGQSEKVRHTNFIYTEELRLVEDGKLKFLCSLENVYLNGTKFKNELDKLLATIGKDKHLALAILNIFTKKVEGVKRSLEQLKEIPYLKLKSAVDKYNADLKDQFS